MVIGDSHCRLFAGLAPGIVIYHVGPALAWSLGDDASTTGGGRRVSAALRGLPREAWALMSFGEIDMRCHVLAHGGPLPCAERYLAFVREARALHDKIALWAPPATQPASVLSDEAYPAVGTVAERNAATAEFAAALSRSEFPVVSLLDLMIEERGGTRRETLDADGRHVSPSLLPEALNRIASRLILNA